MTNPTPIYQQSERINPTFEKHYMVTELAEKWGMDPTTLRRVFRNQSGVLKLISKKRGCREYVSLRVPESVALRVHAKLSR